MVNFVSPQTPAAELSCGLRSTLSEPFHSNDPIRDAGNAVLSTLSKWPETIQKLAYSKLYAYTFREVPICWRRVYEEACLWRVVHLLEGRGVLGKDGKSVHEHVGELETVRSDEWVTEVIALLDRAIMMSGAPGRRELIQQLLDALDEELEARASTNVDSARRAQKLYTDVNGDDNSSSPGEEHRRRSKRRRTSYDSSCLTNHDVPIEFPSPSPTVPTIPLTYPITRKTAPSFQAFQTHVLQVRTPLIIISAIDHWPALTHWRSPQHWMRRTHGGRRLVPVEFGAKYTDESWGQRVVTFAEFMHKHLLQGVNVTRDKSVAQQRGEDDEYTTQVAYLAQHDLLAQIPALRNDISIPDYCFANTPPLLSSSTKTPATDRSSASPSPPPTEPLLNIWLGPAHTISPLHTDPHHNILAQVTGRKYVRLYAPSQTSRVYPMRAADAAPGVDMGNTSRVDVGCLVDAAWAEHGICEEHTVAAAGEEVQRKMREMVVEFPAIEAAEYVEGVLGPGDCLYIPRGWWHYVRALEGVSCSVSFWWD